MSLSVLGHAAMTPIRQTYQMPRQVLFEFIRMGAYVKVSAIDTETNTEVSIVGPPAAGEAALKATALKKLHYVLDKKQRGGAPSPTGGRG